MKTLLACLLILIKTTTTFANSTAKPVCDQISDKNIHNECLKKIKNSEFSPKALIACLGMYKDYGPAYKASTNFSANDLLSCIEVIRNKVFKNTSPLECTKKYNDLGPFWDKTNSEQRERARNCLANISENGSSFFVGKTAFVKTEHMLEGVSNLGYCGDNIHSKFVGAGSKVEVISSMTRNVGFYKEAVNVKVRMNTEYSSIRAETGCKGWLIKAYLDFR